jgi:hypothetical protein
VDIVQCSARGRKEDAIVKEEDVLFRVISNRETGGFVIDTSVK